MENNCAILLANAGTWRAVNCETHQGRNYGKWQIVFYLWFCDRLQTGQIALHNFGDKQDALHWNKICYTGKVWPKQKRPKAGHNGSKNPRPAWTISRVTPTGTVVIRWQSVMMQPWVCVTMHALSPKPVRQFFCKIYGSKYKQGIKWNRLFPASFTTSGNGH